MSPDPVTLFGTATQAQQKALLARGTRASPAYVAVDPQPFIDGWHNRDSN